MERRHIRSGNLLREDQERVAQFIVDGQETYELADVGVGKTAAVLTGLLRLNEEVRRARTLVVAPMQVALNTWPDEINEWSHLKGRLTCDVAIGDPRHRLHAMYGDADIVTMNYENLPWFFSVFTVGNNPFERLVLDEIDKMKSISSKRSKALRPRIKEFTTRIGMTGTPATEGLHEIHPQATLIMPGCFDEPAEGRKKAITSYTAWKKYYFRPLDTRGYKYVPLTGAEEKIYDTIAPFTLRIDAADVIDLPELVEVNRVVTLNDTTMSRYRDLEREMLILLENTEIEAEDDDELIGDRVDFEVEAANRAVLRNKLVQMAAGFSYGYEKNDDERVKRFTKWHCDAKIRSYKDLVSELQGKQVLCVYAYRAQADKLGIPFIGGGTSAADSRDMIQRWNRGDLKELAIHPASAGHGLNLQHSGAHHIAWLTEPWSGRLQKQTIGRLRRQGQNSQNVFSHRFLARGTVDFDVRAALDDKLSGEVAVLEAMKRRTKRI